MTGVGGAESVLPTGHCPEAEKRAAVLIQSYYRRYKQYCYFKKLHRSAVLIQKHYRQYKSQRKGVSQRTASNAPSAKQLELPQPPPPSAARGAEVRALKRKVFPLFCLAFRGPDRID